MKLANYLAKKELSRREFAGRVGVSTEAIRLYIKGDRRPRRGTLQAIHTETGGLVTANDFFSPAVLTDALVAE